MIYPYIYIYKYSLTSFLYHRASKHGFRPLAFLFAPSCSRRDASTRNLLPSHFMSGVLCRKTRDLVKWRSMRLFTYHISAWKACDSFCLITNFYSQWKHCSLESLTLWTVFLPFVAEPSPCGSNMEATHTPNCKHVVLYICQKHIWLYVTSTLLFKTVPSACACDIKAVWDIGSDSQGGKLCQWSKWNRQRLISIHYTAGWWDLQGLIVHQLETAEILCLCFGLF